MKKVTLLACLCCTLLSCENVEKKADEKLQTARAAFERGDFSEAKMQIASIKILYPKAFEARREGIGLMQQVELKEQEKTLVYPIIPLIVRFIVMFLTSLSKTCARYGK